MATQTGAFPFIGTYNGVVGYRIGNKHFFRSIPEGVKQTSATKRASEDFGKASTCGKLIRKALHQAMDIPQDRFLTNRLNSAFAQIIRADKTHKPGKKTPLPEHLTKLKGFAFNNEVKIDTVLLGLQAETEQQDHISVSIPHISKISRTRNTTHVEIKAIAITANFAKEIFRQTTSAAIMIDVQETLQPMELTLPRPGSEATIVILQVRAYQLEDGELKVLADKKYFAADIIAILPPMPVITAKRKPGMNQPSEPVTQKHHFGITLPKLE